MNANEEQLLKKLAVVIIENPRYNTKELAEAVGISKATLHRFCGSRENLMKMIMDESKKALENIICVANSRIENYDECIFKLIDAHFVNKEYLIFACGIQSGLDNEYWESYIKAIDTFFLNGQKMGIFRIDFGVPMLSEMFMAMICGVIDAQRRGRLGTFMIKENILDFYLNGVLKTK